jgi:hypothetical protein
MEINNVGGTKSDFSKHDGIMLHKWRVVK